jgi:hypothetical protein
MRTNQRSFAGGEITSEMFGRVDLTKYQTGLALCRNFLILPHGPATRRPGTDYVNECRSSAAAIRLIPFAFNASQTLVLEFGNLYVRFHTNGQTLLESSQTIGSIAGSTVNLTAHGYVAGDWVYIGTRFYVVATSAANSFTVNTLAGAAGAPSGLSAARVYTLTTPYTTAMLPTLRYTQNADVMTISTPLTFTRTLSRTGTTTWTLSTVSFVPTLQPPTAPSVTPTIPSPTGATAARYGVTSIGADGVTESALSGTTSANNNLNSAGNFNTLLWSPVNGAIRYNVYKLRGGVYGYIGQTSGVAPSTVAITNANQTVTYFGTFPLTNQCVITTGVAHSFVNGNAVAVSGTGVPSMDGTFIIRGVTSTTFTYTPNKPANATSSTGAAGLASCSLIDDNILPSNTQTPPTSNVPLNADIDYPAAVAYFEQRRWFANTPAEPQSVWATRSATESNLTSSIPSREDDALKFRLASQKQNAIQHLVPMIDLLALTAGGVMRIYSDTGPVTPATLTIKPQSAIGASAVQPILSERAALYVQANGNRVRELTAGGPAANFQYQSNDMTIMAPHLFNGFTIVDMAYADEPDKTVWCVRSDGALLGMTYLPDQQVYAWHQHVTAGTVESVCCVSENNIAATYIVVVRTIGARTVRMVERIHTRLFTAAAEAYFVDCGLSYRGAAATTITGLWHLEGRVVSVLADGATVAGLTVTGGTITLPTAASTVHVGLPFNSDLTSLPLALEGAPASGQGTPRNVNRVFLRVTQSSVVQAGPTFDKLTTYPARAVSDPYGSPPDLRAGEISLSITPSWNSDGAVCIRQSEPLPLTVLSMSLDVATGG